MSERFKSLVISHTIEIQGVTHTIQHDFSLAVVCDYCRPLLKRNIFNAKTQSVVEKIGGTTKSNGA